nr:M3 family metallopeptidase [Microlunatus panaciterrae]
MPPFARIEVSHFREALERGMAEQLAEVEAIALSAEEPTMANTIDALERSGRILTRVMRVFDNQTSADTNEELQQIEADFAPRFAAHDDAILLNERLFARIDALYARRDELDLTAEARHVLRRYHLDFVRAGAALAPEQRQRLREINTQLASLSTLFGSNLLADTNASALQLSSRADLDGLSEDAIAAAAAAAQSRGLDGYLITLVLPTHQPALESLTNRQVRRRLYEASVARGSRGNAHDNTDIARQLVVLRAERAELLGYRSHSDYVLADRTAGSNEQLDAMLDQLIAPAVANAHAEQADLAAAMAADGVEDEFAAWDWAFYAEAVRRERYELDTNALRPYFEVDRTLVDGVFFAATSLYGITFTARDDLQAYHPEARVFEVRNADGSELGLFIADYFTRDSKRGGAWMNSLVTQSRLLDQKPVVLNNMNIPKPPPGQPALMSLDEVRTMFHEFGHALHGLFSSVTYPRVAGTAVARDFVEYPSQVNEMWLSWPEVIANYTRHHESAEPLPADVITRIEESSAFNQGFETVSYLAATWLDLCWHRLGAAEARALEGSIEDFERRALEQVGLALETVPPRYRSAYFNHIFASGYASGYYSYIWSEVLDADTVEWFKESGGLQRRNGDLFRDALLARGASGPEMSFFESFRGRPASITPLLERRGLASAPSSP